MLRPGSSGALSAPLRALCLALALVDALAPVKAAARDVIGRSEVRVAWEPAAGDVAAYVVFVSRDGGPYRSEQYTREPSALVAGRAGESVLVRVRAYAATAGGTRTSPASDPSELIRFLPEAAPPAAPARDAVAPPPARAIGSAPPRSTPLRARTASRVLPSLTVQTGGDFDGDGYLDLLATLGSWEHPLALFQRENALKKVASLAPLGPVSAVGSGDFDGDGADELVVKSGDAVSLLRLELSGKATLLRRESLPAAARFLVLDLNGDDEASLLTYEPASGRLVERFARGEATDFGVIRPLHGLHGGDFDGDGRDDLFVQPRAGGDAELWLMRPGGRFEVAPIRLDGNVATAATLDWNGDGRADLAGWDASRGELRAWLLDGARVLERRTLGPGPVESLRALDLDGDERDDLLIAAPDGTATALLATP